jgi:hypothetical protein
MTDLLPAIVGGVLEPGGVFNTGVSGLSEVMLTVIEPSNPASAVMVSGTCRAARLIALFGLSRHRGSARACAVRSSMVERMQQGRSRWMVGDLY